jgi:two-component system phosphate regulon sensor histidine kinase PhoR
MLFSVIFTIALLILGILAAYRIAFTITNPIVGLAGKVRQIASGNMNVSIHSDSKDEIGSLISDVEIMRKSILQADMHKDAFLSNISHELRTPLTVIYGYAELLSEGEEDDQESLQFYCSEIYENSKNLMNNINDLMLITNIEAEPSLTIQEVSLYTIVQNSLDKFSELVSVRKITTTNDIPDTIRIQADENYLQKSIDNVIKNALVFNSVDGQVSVNAMMKDDMVKLYVRDTGIGIPEDMLNRIWEKFFRIDNSITYEVGGVGIGLFLSKRIIELHGGTISATSEPGKGSTFMIDIPVESSVRQDTP